MDYDIRGGVPSASSTAFWNCPGQWQLKQTLTPEDRAALDKPDEYISAGNRVDKARETGNALELSEEEHELYQNGLRFEHLLVEKWLGDFNIPASNYQQGELKNRLWFNHPETLQPLTSGESDVEYVTLPTPTHVIIIDWKLVGPNVARATRNTQLRILAVLKKYNTDGVECIRVAINRCMSKVGGHDYCDYRLDDLKHAENWMLHHLWLSRQPDPPRYPGEWCHHCPCKSICKEAGAFAMIPAATVGGTDELLALKGEALEAKAAELVARLTGPQKVSLWEMKRVIGKILDAVDADLKAMPEDARTALGLTVGKGRALDPITSKLEYFRHLRDDLGWSEEKILACVDFTKGKIAETAQTEKGLSKTAAAAWVKADVAPFITPDTSEGSIKRI